MRRREFLIRSATGVGAAWRGPAPSEVEGTLAREMQRPRVH